MTYHPHSPFDKPRHALAGRLRRLNEPNATAINIRLWRLARRVHSGGIGLLYELLVELEGGVELFDALEHFAAIAIYDDFSRANETSE